MNEILKQKVESIKEWARLVRFPHLFTLPGDPLAGFIIVGGSPFSSDIFPVIISMILMYAFSMVLHEVRQQSKGSGSLQASVRIKHFHAKATVILLLLTGLAAAAIASWKVLLCTAAIALIIYLKNCTKLNKYYSYMHSLCRALGILAGALAANTFSMNIALIVFMSMSFLYSLGLLMLFRNVSKGNLPGIGGYRILSTATSLWGLFVLFLLLPVIQESNAIQPIIAAAAGIIAALLLFIKIAVFRISTKYYSDTEKLRPSLEELMTLTILMQASAAALCIIPEPALLILTLIIPAKISTHILSKEKSNG